MQNLILLHGAIGASEQLTPLENVLREKFKIHTFSFSGHGKVPFQNNFGIKQFATELENFITLHQLIKPAVFGYSMGGYVALYLASQKKDFLGKIITLGTKFEWTNEIAKKEMQQLDPKLITEKVPKFAQALKYIHGEVWEELLAQTAKMMAALGENNLLNDTLMEEIENEVLVGLADSDSMVSLEETTNVFKQLKNGQMYMLPASKHPLETVNLTVLKEVIFSFCK